MEIFLNYWWILILISTIFFHRQILWVLGIIIIPEDKVGLVTKHFVLFGKNKTLPDGKIISINGEAGYQAKTLAPGLYFWFWPWQYEIKMVSFVIIPQGKIGLVSAKDGEVPETGTILGKYVECDNFQDAESFIKNGGKRGRQSKVLISGSYRINRNLFDIFLVDQLKISESKVGLITTLDGKPLGHNIIAGDKIDGHNKFQDFDIFIKNGGYRGNQQEIILAGTYNINPWAVDVSEINMVDIPIGYVGVIISSVGDDGDDIAEENFKHSKIVKNGQRGVWIDPIGPGKHPINSYTTKVEIVPTTNIVLTWSDSKTQSHKLDESLSTIRVRSKDGFEFKLEISQIIHIPSKEAPKVIARFGSVKNLVSQVIEPTIDNYFRNSAQDSDVISFIEHRKERQEAAKSKILDVLSEYNVKAVDTLIGDITPPENLMTTLTDRRIAEEQQRTYETQKMAQENRKELEKATSIANMQSKVVESELSVDISKKMAEASVSEAEGRVKIVQMEAEAESQKINLIGEAEANKIRMTGEATAESYQKQSNAIGQKNLSNLKMVTSMAENGLEITPKVLISGEGNSVDGLLAYKLLDLTSDNKE